MTTQKILSVTLVSFIIFSCGESKTEKKIVENATSKEVPNSVQSEESRVAAETELNRFCGYYVGLFKAVTFDRGKRPSYANKINISIDSLRGEMLYGHSVVAGNLRPFQGAFNFDGEKIHVAAKEPGDDQYDGSFTFQIHAPDSHLSGTWEANDKNLAVTKRKYTLSRKQFKYDPSTPLPDISWKVLYDREGFPWDEVVTEDVLKFNPSVTELKKEDVENMYQADLEIMRNSIYARHGYSFKNRKMRYVFDDNIDWYIPVSTDVTAELTNLEKKNIDLIKRYEKHAEMYYDNFGRQVVFDCSKCGDPPYGAITFQLAEKDNRIIQKDFCHDDLIDQTDFESINKVGRFTFEKPDYKRTFVEYKNTLHNKK